MNTQMRCRNEFVPRRHRWLSSSLALTVRLTLLTLLTWVFISPSAAAREITRISVPTAGTQSVVQSDGSINDLSISPNVRYVAFISGATNLGEDGHPTEMDVFVHDRQTGTTSVVTSKYDSRGRLRYRYSSPAVSADGRFVAYASWRTSFFASDTRKDVYVWDRRTRSSFRVSVASDGALGNGYSREPLISADGRYVAFTSQASNLVADDTNNEDDIFVHDRNTGMTERVSVANDAGQANYGSSDSSISADGRYVSFLSEASNLVADDTNNEDDIFVHDRNTGMTERVSVSSDGSQGNEYSYSPSISAGGDYVAFGSGASNLVPDDTNDIEDVFVHDRQTGMTERISVGSDGSQGNEYSSSPSISAGGGYVSFVSQASNLVADEALAKLSLAGDQVSGSHPSSANASC